MQYVPEVRFGLSESSHSETKVVVLQEGAQEAVEAGFFR